MEIKTDYMVNGILVETSKAEGSEGTEGLLKRLTQYEKRKDYLNSYRSANYDEIKIRLRRDGSGEGFPEGITKEGLRDAAEAAGMSLSEFIIQRICEGMRQHGEVATRNVNGPTSKNEAFLVRGDMASELYASARDLGEDPRDMVLKAVRDYYIHKINERETESHLQQQKNN